MKFEDIKNSSDRWGLLESSDMFDDGFLLMIREEYELDKILWDEIHEIGYYTSSGPGVGKFVFFKDWSDLHKFMMKNKTEYVNIEFHHINDKILVLGID